MTKLTIKSISREKMPLLYYPASDWRSGTQYPPIKPETDWISRDYLRLAWEVLRRTPRYRWHYQRLRDSGLLDARAFKGKQYHFVAGGSFIPVPGWDKICLDDHFCKPFARPKQLLGDYSEEHQGTDWLVMHGTRWALKLWGVSEIHNPDTTHDQIHLDRLFAPSFPTSLPEGNGVLTRLLDIDDGDSPVPLTMTVERRELLVRLRLDMSAKAQTDAIYKLLLQAQQQVGLSDVNDGARATDVDIASFWLRTWDAEQAVNTAAAASTSLPKAAKTTAKRPPLRAALPRTELIACIDEELQSLPAEVTSRTITKKVKPPRKNGENASDRKDVKPTKQKVNYLADIQGALEVARVDKWRKKAHVYIEGRHEFYRRILALSLEH